MLPIFIVAVSSVILWAWPFILKKLYDIREIKAFLVILPLLPYVLFFFVILLGWRYNNTGLVLTAFILALSYFVFSQYSGMPLKKIPLGFSYFEASVFLLPINLVLFSMMTKRRIFSSVFVVCVFLVGIQVLAVFLLYLRPNAADSFLVESLERTFPRAAVVILQFFSRLDGIFQNDSLSIFKHLSFPALTVYIISFFLLLVRFVVTREAIQAAYFGLLIATFLSCIFRSSSPGSVIYFSAAGLILIVATIESSYVMAYVDELTGLQGRRSLNETLLNLGHKYAIAMIDVDHFKKFNDTYGHKSGDQVLKMIAAQLSKISGGAKTFRYGGEEFSAIFLGKSAEEAHIHLEKYRQLVAATPFVVRGKQRRKGNSKSRGKLNASDRKQVQVTVSIGVAAPDKAFKTPDKVLKAADRLLYRAKKAGRNRVIK